MKLLTESILKQLPPLRGTESKTPDEIQVICKFFAPWASWTWYVTEGEKISEDDYEFYGLVCGHEIELGYFRLSDLKSVRGFAGLTIERDLYFSPVSLKKITEIEENQHGR